jgi:hypothetical protein
VKPKEAVTNLIYQQGERLEIYVCDMCALRITISLAYGQLVSDPCDIVDGLGLLRL